MSQPHWNRNGRWLKLSLVTLVVLNLALMATIWLPQLKHNPDEESKARGIGGREHDIALQFLEETLSLSPQQKEITAKLRSDHFLKSDALRKEINWLRRQIMDEVFAASPDKGKVERLAVLLGEKQGNMEMLTFNHFLDLLNLCQPDQKEKFRSMMGELLDRLKPPPPDSRRRPKEEVRRREERPAEEGAAGKRTEPDSRLEESFGEVARTRNQIERFRDRLGLSHAQVEKLTPILEQFARQIDECRGKAYGDPRTLQQAEKIIKDRRDGAIKFLLTPEQVILFEQMKKERRGQNPPPRPFPEE
jgi:periplasmic protein CpxP/Spy